MTAMEFFGILFSQNGLFYGNAGRSLVKILTYGYPPPKKFLRLIHKQLIFFLTYRFFNISLIYSVIRFIIKPLIFQTESEPPAFGKAGPYRVNTNFSQCKIRIAGTARQAVRFFMQFKNNRFYREGAGMIWT